MIPILEAYLGKRFAGLLVVCGVLAAAYFNGPAEKFATLATTLGLIYGVYVGGQTFTDAKDK